VTVPSPGAGVGPASESASRSGRLELGLGVGLTRIQWHNVRIWAQPGPAGARRAWAGTQLQPDTGNFWSWVNLKFNRLEA
jgi:hypothetical protein